MALCKYIYDLKQRETSDIIVPIICLYIKVVVVGDFIFCYCIVYIISFLLVTVGIVYNRAGSSINVAINILFDGENISFDTSLVIYIVLIFLQL